MHKYPQILENVRVKKKIDVNASPAIQGAVQQVEKRLNGAGRVVLRPSGTEPVIRVMVEGRDEALVRQLAKELAASVVAAAV
jgi:phosphoglucosamine mutase